MTKVEAGPGQPEQVEPALPQASPAPPRARRRRLSPDVRRYVWACAIGILVTAPGYLFVLWDEWGGRVSLLRKTAPSDFYELQARAIVHGKLSVPTNSLGIEGFVHDGRTYTYFGIFLSLLRIPVLALFRPLSGHLAGPSMFVAWALIALFTSLLVWRVRVLMRPGDALGRLEAASYGLLVASVTGGSVLVFLAQNPWVYDEDLAWSAALTVGVMFALVGLLERPTWKRLTLSAVVVLCAALTRPTTGWACVIGAGLAGLWLLVGWSGSANRRWAWWVFGTTGVTVIVACSVNYAKFGTLFSLPFQDQVWTHVNAYRRHFLAVNGGSEFRTHNLPSTLLAYLKLDGIRLSGLFPFVTLPGSPASTVGRILLDQTSPTGSLTATMPLMFLLACWGVITGLLARGRKEARVLRLPILIGMGATIGVLWVAYIANRYLADFLPLLVIGAAVGLVDLWGRLKGRRPAFRRLFAAAVAVLALFGLYANWAIAVQPDRQFTIVQARNFFHAQTVLSLSSVAASVRKVDALPHWGPLGQLYIVGNCSGLYDAIGFSYADVPGPQRDHATFIPVEQNRGINTVVDVQLPRHAESVTGTVPVLRYGVTRLVIVRATRRTLRLEVQQNEHGRWVTVKGGGKFTPKQHVDLSVMTDPNLTNIQVSFGSGGVQKHEPIISQYLPGRATPVVLARSGGSSMISVAPGPAPPVNMSLCRSLLHG